VVDVRSNVGAGGALAFVGDAAGKTTTTIGSTTTTVGVRGNTAVAAGGLDTEGAHRSPHARA